MLRILIKYGSQYLQSISKNRVDSIVHHTRYAVCLLIIGLINIPSNLIADPTINPEIIDKKAPAAHTEKRQDQPRLKTLVIDQEDPISNDARDELIHIKVSPKGKLPRWQMRSKIKLRFSHPMVSHDHLYKTAKPTIKITPAHSGYWYWSNVKTLIFKPKKDWKVAQNYTIHISGPFTSINAAQLGSDFNQTFSFNTQVNQLESVRLYNIKNRLFDNNNAVTLHPLIRICFKYPIASQILNLVSLHTLQNNKSTKLSLKTLTSLQMKHISTNLLKSSYNTCYWLASPKSFLKDTDYTLVVQQVDTRGGALINSKKFRHDFSTYAPLQLNKITHGEHATSGPIYLNFNHEVSWDQLKSSLHIIHPQTTLNKDLIDWKKTKRNNIYNESNPKYFSRNSWSIYGFFKANHTYLFTLDPTPIVDQFNQKLTQRDLIRYPFTTYHADPYFSRLKSHATIEAIDIPMSMTYHTNLEDLCLQWYQLTPKTLAQYFYTPTLLRRTELLPLTPDQCFTTKNPEQTITTRIPLSPFRFTSWKQSLPTSKLLQKTPKQRMLIDAEVVRADAQAQAQAQAQVQAQAQAQAKIKTTNKTSHSPTTVLHDPKKCQANPQRPKAIKLQSWLDQRPRAFSSDEFHFYLLYADWSWYNKNDARSDPKKYPCAEWHHNTQKTLVQISHLGLHVKATREHAYVMTWNLRTGKAIPNTEVQLLNPKGDAVLKAYSNAHGVAYFDLSTINSQQETWLPTNRVPKLLWIANTGHDQAFVFASDAQRIYVSSESSSIWYSQAHYHAQRGLIWTERDLYRPGDDVYISGVVAQHTHKGLQAIANTDFTLKIRDARYEEIRTYTVHSDEVGYIKHKFTLPANSALGSYEAKVVLKSNLYDTHPMLAEMSWSRSFEVKNFQIPKFIASAQVTPHSQKDKTLNFYASGRYLYDAPMSNQRWSAEVYNMTQSFYPNWSKDKKYDPILKTFQYGVTSEYDYSTYNEITETNENHFGYVTSEKGKLDQQGYGEINVEIQKLKGRIVEYASTFTIIDEDERSTQAQSHASIHPANTYLGLKRIPKDKSTQDSLAVKVVAIDHKTLQRVAVSQVKVSLFRRFWNTVYIKDEVGRQRAQSDWEWKQDGACLVDINQQTSSTCRLKPSGAGYFLWIAEAVDSNDDALLALRTHYVYGYEAQAWEIMDGHELVIKNTNETQKKLKVGETLKIVVESPYKEAYAWITVEQNDIIQQEFKVWKSGELLELPVTAKMIPNARVTVTLFQGRTADPNQTGDLGRPSYRYGSYAFKVDHKDKELDVSIRLDEEYKQPGDTLEINVQAQDKQGKAVGGKVIVWAVDRGVISLTHFKPPRILESLYKSLTFHVMNASSLTHLLPHLSEGEKGRPVGGGGDDESEMGNNGMTIRKVFRVVPFFLDTLQLDTSGNVKTSVKLPDNLTTFEIFAMVIQHDTQDVNHHTLRSGQSQSKVVVRKPLMVRSAMPSVLTKKDRFMAGVTLHSTVAKKMRIQVQGSIKGSIKALAPLTKQLDLPAIGTTIVRFPFVATDVGKADLLWTVTELLETDQTNLKEAAHESQTKRKKWQDGIQYTIPVRPLALKQVKAIHGSTEDKDIHKIKIPDADDVQLDLELNSSILSSFLSDAQTLLDYPYGCLEQRSSKILPYAIFKELGQHYGRKLSTVRPKGKNDLSEAEIIQSHLQVLSRMQHHTGGLRYWPNHHSAVHAWASTYAWMVLSELARADYALPLVDLKALKNFIRTSLQKTKTLNHQLYWSPSSGQGVMSAQSAAFMLYALARYDQPDLKTENLVFKNHQQLPIFGKALLAAAMSMGKITMPLRTQRATFLIDQLINSLDIDGDEVRIASFDSNQYAYDFDSQERSLSIILIALLHNDPKHDLILPLIRTLLRAKNGLGTLANTQASAFALMAIRDYIMIRENEASDFTAYVKTYVPSQKTTKHTTATARKKLDLKDLTQKSFKGVNLQREQQSYTMDHYPMLKQLQGLQFSKTGTGVLYYQARISYLPKKISHFATQNGMTLVRQYRLYDSRTAQGKTRKALLKYKKNKKVDPILYTHSYKAGDLVEVELELHTSIKRHYVVIQDPLPAGLELIDTDLKTWAQGYNSMSSYFFDHIELGKGEVRLFADTLSPGYHRFTYLARAITAGTFSRVAAHAEEMYHPDISANSTGGQLWIHP